MAKVGGLKVTLLGADELSQAFSEVRDSMKRQVTRRAVGKAAQVVVPALRRATPKSKKGDKSKAAAAKNPPGTTRKSTGRVARKYKGGAVQSQFIGHRWPKGAAAHLVEGGTKERYRKGKLTKSGSVSSGRSGKVVARRFFKHVWDSNQSKVHDTLQRELAAGLEAAREKAALKSLAKFVNKK